MGPALKYENKFFRWRIWEIKRKGAGNREDTIQFRNPVEKAKLWLWKKLFPEIQFLIIWYWKLATIEKINWKLIFYTEFVGIFLSFQYFFFEKNSFNFFPPIGRKTTACRRPHWITQSLKIQQKWLNVQLKKKGFF